MKMRVPRRLAADINDFDTPGFDGFGTELQGFDDWASLEYNFRASVDFADGTHLSVILADEIPLDEALAISPDSDGDDIRHFLDNCPFNATDRRIPPLIVEIPPSIAKCRHSCRGA